MPTRASVVTSDSTMAMAGAMATPPPFAPIRASVLVASVAEEDRCTSRAPVNTTPSAMRAVVRSVSRVIAKAAPMPASPDATTPAPTGSAVTVLASALCAVRVTSPPVRCSVP